MQLALQPKTVHPWLVDQDLPRPIRLLGMCTAMQNPSLSVYYVD